MRSPRLTLPIGLLLSMSLLMGTGCTVLDEIDSAAAKMPAKPGAAAPAKAGAAAAPAGPNALLESSKQWWDKATSLAPGQMDSQIVNCRIGQSAQFMSKDDCLTRGGVPQGKS